MFPEKDLLENTNGYVQTRLLLLLFFFLCIGSSGMCKSIAESFSLNNNSHSQVQASSVTH